MEEDKINPIVIDNGSGMIKGGFGGEEAPKICFPNVVGEPKFDNIHGYENKEFYIGMLAKKYKNTVMDLKYPIENGVVKDWDLMRKVWSYTYFNELKCDPSEHSVFLTQSPNNPKKNKEKTLEIFFEQFAIPSLYMYSQGTLALYASGFTTGLVIDAGHGKIDCLIVYENLNINHAVGTLKWGGKVLNNELNNVLMKKNENLKYINDEVIYDIKENHTYFPLDFEEELKNYDNNLNDVDYELPDGSSIKLGKELIEIPEIIFQPHLHNIESKNLNNIIYESIQKVDHELRKKLYSNVVLAGGNTLIKGFVERINKEIHSIAPSLVNVKINSPPERKYSVWIGGSILSTLSQFQSSWITRNEYEDTGVSIVHRKCL